METNKIKLQRSRNNWINYNDNIKTQSITYALPYYKSNRGVYYHRVRSADSHWSGSQLSHISIRLWCGGHGFLDDKGILAEKVPEKEILCATCEGRAIGAGLDGSRIINGREVRYSPRKSK